MDAFGLDSHDLPLPVLHLRLLGGFAASIDGIELTPERWPSLRAAQLVQLLSLQPRRRLTRDQVIDALWPRLEPDAGAANLRKAVHHARHALGRHDAVLMQGGEVLLWSERPMQVDADDFERAAGAALARRDAAECAEAARAYGGALLPGSLYEAWTVAARERLHARQLELLRVAGLWDKLAQLEPTDEPAHRALMQRELQAGNRAAALRWYAHLREALQESLGVAPDRQTDALYERCVAGLQPSGPAFVGRALAIAQAMAWLGVAPAERIGGIVLRGPGGIGKTALGGEIAEQARARGWRVLRGAAVRRARPRADTAQVAGALRRQLRPHHRGGAGRSGARVGDAGAGCRIERGRAAASGQPICVPARPGAPGAGGSGSAAPAHADAPPHRGAADRTGRGAGRHRPPLAGRWQAA